MLRQNVTSGDTTLYGLYRYVRLQRGHMLSILAI